jgi:hypothetical protein
VLLLALLQLAAGGLAPVADAAARAVSLASTLRVEAADTEHCGSHHGHVTCQFCRVMSLVGETASPARSVDVACVRAFATGFVPAHAVPGSVRISGGLGSRAPPLA